MNPRTSINMAPSSVHYSYPCDILTKLAIKLQQRSANREKEEAISIICKAHTKNHGTLLFHPSQPRVIPTTN